MGLFDRFRKREVTTSSDPPRIVAAVLDNENEYTNTFDNRNITFTGDLSTYDYDSILRDKQKNINSLFELSDYYVDKDPIYRGIIRGVYAAFSMSDWKLIGTNEKTKEKYQQYYERIGLKDRMASIFYQYFKYANVYVYLMEDGSLITLPVHKTRIANIMLNGEPVVEYNVSSITSDVWNNGTSAEKPFVDDEKLDVKLKGYPPEVIEGVKKN